MLHRVGAQSVPQPDPPSLLSEIKQHTAAAGREHAQALAQLVTTVTAKTAEQIADRTRRVNTNGHGIGPLLPAPDQHRHVLEHAIRLAKGHETGVLGAHQGNRTGADLRELGMLGTYHGLDLLSCDSQDRAALQLRAQWASLLVINPDANDRRQKTSPARQRQTSSLGR